MLVETKTAARAGAAERAEAVADVTVLALWAGAVLSITTVISIAALWWPHQFGFRPWEFVTVTRSFDRYPLLVVGLLLWSGGAFQRGSRRALRVTAGGYAVAILLSLAFLALFGLAALEGWRDVSADGQGVFVRTTIVTVLFASLYIAVFGFGAARTVIRLRKASDG